MEFFSLELLIIIDICFKGMMQTQNHNLKFLADLNSRVFNFQSSRHNGKKKYSITYDLFEKHS